MKYAYVDSNNIVQEILPEINPAFPDIHIRQRYPVDFIKHLTAVPDGVQVEQNWVYDKASNTFSEPLDPINNPVTIEDFRVSTLARIDGHCSAAIQNGVVVDGKRYSLSVPIGQINLSVAIAQADSGQTDIPFSAIDETKPAHYTPEQIKVIGKAANEWGIVNTTYYSYLKNWIERETDIDILNGIEYGSPLPDDLMQEFTENLAGFGIDVAQYIGKLGVKDER